MPMYVAACYNFMKKKHLKFIISLISFLKYARASILHIPASFPPSLLPSPLLTTVICCTTSPLSILLHYFLLRPCQHHLLPHLHLVAGFFHRCCKWVQSPHRCFAHDPQHVMLGNQCGRSLPTVSALATLPSNFSDNPLCTDVHQKFVPRLCNKKCY